MGKEQAEKPQCASGSQRDGKRAQELQARKVPHSSKQKPLRGADGGNHPQTKKSWAAEERPPRSSRDWPSFASSTAPRLTRTAQHHATHQARPSSISSTQMRPSMTRPQRTRAKPEDETPSDAGHERTLFLEPAATERRADRGHKRKSGRQRRQARNPGDDGRTPRAPQKIQGGVMAWWEGNTKSRICGLSDCQGSIVKAPPAKDFPKLMTYCSAESDFERAALVVWTFFLSIPKPDEEIAGTTAVVGDFDPWHPSCRNSPAHSKLETPRWDVAKPTKQKMHKSKTTRAASPVSGAKKSATPLQVTLPALISTATYVIFQQISV